MKIIRIIHTLIIALWLVISFIIGSIIVFTLSLFSKHKANWFHSTGSIWARLLLFVAGTRVSVRGLKNIDPKKTYILASNHQGIIDIPILDGYFPLQFKFIIKKELFKVPFFGWYIRKCEYLAIDRIAARSAKQTLNEAVNVLSGGTSILIFPEGTRSRDGKLGSFKSGIADIYLKSKVPVLPIAISGSYETFRRGSRLYYPKPIKISIGKPLEFNYDPNDRESLAKITEDLKIRITEQFNNLSR
ncbi:MAG: lysophospholipid acyltransferase family protein [bacterium]